MEIISTKTYFIDFIFIPAFKGVTGRLQELPRFVPVLIAVCQNEHPIEKDVNLYLFRDQLEDFP